MALRKSQLYSSLWQSCDELRGGMDASQYKDYVLTLLFMKYVSDRYAGRPDALIVVPDGGGFADMVRLKGDKEIGDRINKIIGNLAETNDLKGVIDQADFNDSAKLGAGKEMQEMDLIPPELVAARYFSRERAVVDELRRRHEGAAGELAAFVDEHTGEGGLLEGIPNDRGKVTRGAVHGRIGAIQDEDDPESVEERDALARCLALLSRDSVPRLSAGGAGASRWPRYPGAGYREALRPESRPAVRRLRRAGGPRGMLLQCRPDSLARVHAGRRATGGGDRTIHPSNAGGQETAWLNPVSSKRRRLPPCNGP